jgi:signal transduction histidine kinase
MHGEGRITLRVWEEDGDTLMLRVSDNGPGISPEIIRRIFHPFFTTKTTGSGIGLATARKVVEAHGGWLDVMSEQGKGATFTMRLPLKQGEEELPSGDEDAA